LVETLVSEVGLGGSGRLLDLGCGPGVLATALAGCFAEAVGLDPDAEMLAEGARQAIEQGVKNIRWVQALAEDLLALDLGKFKLVTLGQSFHWTDRERVTDTIYDLLEPGGALALIEHHGAEGRPQPIGPGHPPIPHDAIRAIIHHYLGPHRRAGQGLASLPTERHAAVFARSRFGGSRILFCEGRPDIVQDIDAVLANYFSMSFAAPHLFGDRLDLFEADVRAELMARSPCGLFWDWPGDTEILLAVKTAWQ
jgi:SAM-dependent methyltransferase